MAAVIENLLQLLVAHSRLLPPSGSGVVRTTGEPARWCIGEIPPSKHLSFASRAAAHAGSAGSRAASGLRGRRARSGVRARADREARRSLQPHRHGARPGDISRARGGVAGRDPHAAPIHEGAELSGDRSVANGLAQATPHGPLPDAVLPAGTCGSDANDPFPPLGGRRYCDATNPSARANALAPTACASNSHSCDYFKKLGFPSSEARCTQHACLW